MADGIVEELFLAPAIGTGIQEVWFRNYSVVANLGLRAAGTLAEDPESVAWGQTKEKFVVRTGTGGNDYKYYLFHIPRVLNTIFPPLVTPTIILDRIVTPYTSTLLLIAVSATKTTINHTRSVVGQSMRGPYILCGASWAESSLSISIESQSDTSTTTPVSGSDTETLGSLLTNFAAYDVRYGLNDAGDLVLLLTLDPGVVINVPVVARDERHLYVVRIAGATEEILFRTAEASASFGQTVHTTGVTLPWTVRQEHYIRIGGGGPGGNDPGADFLQTMPSASGLPPHSEVTIDGGLVQSGTSLLDNSLWDLTLPFIQDTVFIASSVSTSLSLVIGTAFGFSACASARGDFNGAWIKQTWTLQPIWRYIVRRAYPLQLTPPINFLMVVERRHTGTGVRQHGLFLKTDLGWKTISPFTTNPAGFVTLDVMTANQYHALWYRQATVSAVYLTALRSNVTKLVGTDLAQLRNYYFRLIQGDLANPVDILWQGAEPAGAFLDGWETDGTPTLTDVGGGFPLTILDEFARLADLPPGVVPPVIPQG